MSKTSPRPLPPLSRVLQLLSYDPISGHFTRRVKCNRMAAGSRAGKLRRKTRYRSISIDGQECLEGRLAWLIMTGEDPPNEIDHRNLTRDDNSWDNLRNATDQGQQANTPLSKANTSGHKGVSWDRNRSAWAANICVSGKAIFLGRFGRKEDAAEAYVRAATSHFGEFARAA